MNERHELMWKVGAWLFGHEVDEQVPPLQSRKLKKKGGAAPVEPEQPSEPVEPVTP